MAGRALDIENDVINTNDRESILTFSKNCFILSSYFIHFILKELVLACIAWWKSSIHYFYQLIASFFRQLLCQKGPYLSYTVSPKLASNWYSMKIKKQTRKRSAGCSKHCFEVVDRTDEVSNKYTPRRSWRDLKRFLKSMIYKFNIKSRTIWLGEALMVSYFYRF